MIEEYQIRILPEQAASEEGIKRYLSKEKGIDVRTLNQVRVLKRSIDARQRTIYVNLKVRAYINEFAQDDQYIHTEYPDVSSRPRVVVVGEGPGGLFASLRLIELGYRPVVLERGKDVRERKGSFFTPQQWVSLSQDYLAAVCEGDSELVFKIIGWDIGYLHIVHSRCCACNK